MRRYGFNCAYCSSRLEAAEGQGGQEGQCPTCGNSIVIPLLDRQGRLVDPFTRKIIKPDPHPVHAYAAAGGRAPRILREPDGAQHILCPKCQTLNSIAANVCRTCQMPFTMEGISARPAGQSDGFAVASLVLGIIGIPSACALIPSLLAVVFGVLALAKDKGAGARGGRGMAIAGIVCGGVGLLLFARVILS